MHGTPAIRVLPAVATVLLICSAVSGAITVPPAIQQPGTQPLQVSSLESPDKCDNCHGNYNKSVEPAFNWRGSMMANAGRDPIFWATVAIAEQDFDGSGDLCIRCHSTSGWMAGRSTPTDGSGLAAGDADGVDCDTCHKMTNPDRSEHPGVMTWPFIANNGAIPPVGFLGSGMLSLYSGSAKLGPYSETAARHQSMQSKFHRSVDFCGSCHDVSNAVTGDLAHNNGAATPLAPGSFSGSLTSSLDQKAAFKNFPFKYGVVERTFSEFKSGALSQTLVSSYNALPASLKSGAIKAAYDSAKGNYSDGTPRYFSCQTCHMRAVTGQGANKSGTPVRADLPLHDMTGGNYWAPDTILHQNANATLRLGGGLTATQIDAIQAGKARAQQQLRLAASLQVDGDVLTITKLTGHKLITGYPEGRRMWVNVRWYDAEGWLVREDGRYGPMTVSIDGTPTAVNSILDLDDEHTRIYQAHYGMTQEWASQLLSLGYKASMPLTFDRVTGAVTLTLGELAGRAPGTSAETFHFVLNNVVIQDNRIPPWGMRYDDALLRNTRPVTSAPQYGTPGPGGVYNHYDTLALSGPAGAVRASIRLLYQPTSWEYVQFLHLANNRSNAFLGNEGVNLLATWKATAMAEPFVMAEAAWGTPAPVVCTAASSPSNLQATGGKRAVSLKWTASSTAPSGYRIYYDQSGKLQFLAAVAGSTTTYKDGGLSRATLYCYVVTAWKDCNENGVFDAGIDSESAPTTRACASAQ